MSEEIEVPGLLQQEDEGQYQEAVEKIVDGLLADDKTGRPSPLQMPDRIWAATGVSEYTKDFRLALVCLLYSGTGRKDEGSVRRLARARMFYDVLAELKRREQKTDHKETTDGVPQEAHAGEDLQEQTGQGGQAENRPQAAEQAGQAENHAQAGGGE